MSRFSSVMEASPAGTVVVVGTPAWSNAVSVESATDARVYINVSAFGAGGTLDCDVYISHDGTDYAKIGSFTTIVATGKSVLAFDRHQIGKYMKLYYTALVGNATFSAKVEKKQS